VTRNQRLGEVLYLARYIEKFGTGTLMMIRETTAHALPEPDFEPSPGEFLVVLWKDWLTPALFDRLGLNERQRTAMAILRAKRQVTNAGYQKATGAARATVKRDLEELVRIGLVRLVGAGRGASYVLVGKRLTIGSIGSSADPPANGPEMAQSAHRVVKPAGKSATPASPPASGKGSRGGGKKRP
jgi:ATP-dependent DNA helicase RecG